MAEWRDIPGWEDVYQCSDDGKVRSLDREVEQVGNKGSICVRKLIGQELKPNKRSGYEYVSLRQPGIQFTISVHQLVLQTFVGPPPPNCEVRHLDGTRDNNVLSNLCYGTKKDNARDRDLHGRTYRGEMNHMSRVKGEDNWSAKLTNDQVRSIRRRYCAGESIRSISTDYPVCWQSIKNIVSYATWPHM